MVPHILKEELVLKVCKDSLAFFRTKHSSVVGASAFFYVFLTKQIQTPPLLALLVSHLESFDQPPALAP